MRINFFGFRLNNKDTFVNINKSMKLPEFEDKMKLIRGEDVNKRLCIYDSKFVYMDKSQVLDKVNSLILEKIKRKLNRIDPDKTDDHTVKEMLKRLMISHHVNEKNLDKVKEIKKILKGIDNFEAYGSAPQVYNNELRYVKGEDVKNLVKFFISEATFSLNIASTKLLKALLIKHDPYLLSLVTQELQRVSKQIVEDMNAKKSISPHEQMLTEMLVGNILAIYPFMEPSNGQPLAIPQFLNGKWQLIDYTVEKMQITHPSLGDPLSAYGLTPKNLNLSAPPLLLFMGTPPPTTTGVDLAEWVDLVPGRAVGEVAYEYAEEKLVDWINKANEKCGGKKVQLYGQSLGGSLALICACSHPDKVGKVYAYNPPAPTEEMLNRYKSRIASLDKLPEINVYVQQNDPVSCFGKGWSLDWNVHKVVPQNVNPSGYLAHIQAFSGQKKVLVHKIDIRKDAASKKRQIINKIVNEVKVPVFGWKTFKLKVGMLRKWHNLSSFVSMVRDVGISTVFKVMFSMPNQKEPFIKTLVNDMKTLA